MLIVAATLEHLNAIHAIEEECYSTPWSRETLARELTDPSVTAFAAQELTGPNVAAFATEKLTGPNVAGLPVPDGCVAGYTFMRRSFDEGHIENIAVSPAARGRGIASRLMEALLAWAGTNGLTSVALEVRQGNRAAMGLYHKYGFRVEGYRRDYYTNPSEDAVLMRKNIKTSINPR